MAAEGELPERWSAPRKTGLVLRLLRSEPLDAVSREPGARARVGELEAAIDRLPEFNLPARFRPGGARWHHRAHSRDDIEGAFQDAVAGRPAELPFADICIPSIFDGPWRRRAGT
jgi:hypothetical protein